MAAWIATPVPMIVMAAQESRQRSAFTHKFRLTPYAELIAHFASTGFFQLGDDDAFRVP